MGRLLPFRPAPAEPGPAAAGILVDMGRPRSHEKQRIALLAFAAGALEGLVSQRYKVTSIPEAPARRPALLRRRVQHRQVMHDRGEYIQIVPVPVLVLRHQLARHLDERDAPRPIEIDPLPVDPDRYGGLFTLVVVDPPPLTIAPMVFGMDQTVGLGTVVEGLDAPPLASLSMIAGVTICRPLSQLARRVPDQLRIAMVAE